MASPERTFPRPGALLERSGIVRFLPAPAKAGLRPARRGEAAGP
jgi:hypothetical protein